MGTALPAHHPQPATATAPPEMASSVADAGYYIANYDASLGPRLYFIIRRNLDEARPKPMIPLINGRPRGYILGHDKHDSNFRGYNGQAIKAVESYFKCSLRTTRECGRILIWPEPRGDDLNQRPDAVPALVLRVQAFLSTWLEEYDYLPMNQWLWRFSEGEAEENPFPDGETSNPGVGTRQQVAFKSRRKTSTTLSLG